nr:PhzF family phenazine biosynthesis protein [Zymomonas mobilis]
MHIYISGKFKGNLIAVISAIDNLSTEERPSVAHYMKLGETTFLLKQKAMLSVKEAFWGGRGKSMSIRLMILFG